MKTARYIGYLDGTNEESLPDDMQRLIPLFNLLRPVGKYPAGATLTLEDLWAIGFEGVPTQAREWVKGEEI